MKKYTLLNNVTGWITFLISAVVYIMTIEPTASFWDCGEFIAASDKLLVGHPPGAPFFMIMGRFFALLAGGDQGSVAVMINMMSALASAFTILFLFWTITHLARKIFMDDEEPAEWRSWAVIAAGLVGALAYTFSDTFWFSAVEGEVYAMSSLFTAVVFWAILKWENVADQPHSTRWLILIAYLMGLSIGVHLLNLLAIPAIAMVYYYKNFEITRKNTIWALLISAAILITILYVIIPGVILVASWVELLFVNSFGLPYNSGALFYAFLLIGAIVAGIWYTHKNSKIILNTILVGVTVILIGYSSFAMIVIRSNANPTMDQNSPDDVFSLMSYLNREQYGDRPLFTGQHYNTPIDRKATESKKGSPIYIRKNDRYEIAEYKTKYVYDDNATTLFPRMYSREPRHIEEYKSWAGITGKKVDVKDDSGQQKTITIPTFGENLTFFFTYQVNHMYLRYFLWNFAGRQNDMQGNGELNRGNWITGFSFIDNTLYGDQSNLPDIYSKNKAHNKYYLLPLLLGVAGMLFQYGKGKKGRQGFWIVGLLFFLTGLAIVMYLNQTPLQPRERDYAFAGSFYAFAIWIGLGALAAIELLNKWLSGKTATIAGGALCLIFVPGLMAAENWDDHNRSDRYIARDLAYNYLNTCDENAIIFTNGDNDTFPLWYIQEVEGVRTDVRVCNLSYLQTDWYIDQMKRKAYLSEPLPFSLTHDQYVTGKRDVVYLIDRIGGRVDLQKALDFVASEDPRTKQVPNYNERIDYLPSDKLALPIDSTLVVTNGTIEADAAHLVSKEININLKKNYILKNELMILDLLATNNWERPVYYAVTVGSENYVGLDNYFQLDGFAYRVVPINSPASEDGQSGRVNTEKMYKKVMETFRWSGFDNPKVYLDENHIRMGMNIRNNLGRLANALVDEQKPEKALDVLNLAMKVLPADRIPHNYFSLFLAEAYFKANQPEMGDRILSDFANDNLKELQFYSSLSERKQESVMPDMQRSIAIYLEIAKIAQKYNRQESLQQLEGAYKKTLQQFQYMD